MGEFTNYADFFGLNEDTFKKQAEQQLEQFRRQQEAVRLGTDDINKNASKWGYAGASDLEGAKKGLNNSMVSYGDAVKRLEDPAMLQAAMQRSGQRASFLDAAGVAQAGNFSQEAANARKYLVGAETALGGADAAYSGGQQQKAADDKAKAAAEAEAARQDEQRQRYADEYEGWLESTGQFDNEDNRSTWLNKTRGGASHEDSTRNRYVQIGQQKRTKQGGKNSFTWDMKGAGSTGTGW